MSKSQDGLNGKFFEALENAGRLYEDYLETAGIADLGKLRSLEDEYAAIPPRPNEPLTLEIRTTH